MRREKRERNVRICEIPEIHDVRRIHLYIRSISSDRSRSDYKFDIVFLRVEVPFCYCIVRIEQRIFFQNSQEKSLTLVNETV